MNTPLKRLGRVLLKGLVAILPIGLTIYVVYWLGVTTETVLSGPLKWLLPPGIALACTGLGIAATHLQGRRGLGVAKAHRCAIELGPHLAHRGHIALGRKAGDLQGLGATGGQHQAGGEQGGERIHAVAPKG